ncbi:hypothetical protein BDU57DRAFT_178396 [Ampelomyces quisqualis]|uniref:BTB domain-containing protein n=1 Tax=Ampelomyces quisqualis TaxID=50730 RepID=A0A6A5QSQ5_AMPQU|nr:hypothetical protein BDU57DRAFT_178396 [Ampelomyces quisqualis]
MSLQRSANRPSKPALQKTTSFTLPGRRTLSEHLPAEIIDVPMTLAQRSSYLRKAIAQQALKDPRQTQFSLPNIDSMGFRMYMEWLRTGHVEVHALTHESSSKGLLLRDCFDLFFAHMAGSQLGEPDFQDYIIDTMARLLDVSQTPDLKVLEVVFLEKGASNTLKQFVVDRMFAVERKMLGMMRGLVGKLECAESGRNKCEYHVHQEGECYRDRLKRTCAGAIRGTNAGLHHGTTTTYDGRQSPSFNPPTLYTEETVHKMTDASYPGSVEWSQDLSINKPLPTIPPLTPGPSLSPQPSPQPSNSPNVLPTHPASKPTSTQHLIAECLSRLPPTKPTPAHTPSKSTQPAISSLILECLERLETSSLKTSPPTLPHPIVPEKSSEYLSPSKVYIAPEKQDEEPSPLRTGMADIHAHVPGLRVSETPFRRPAHDGQCLRGTGLVQETWSSSSVPGVRRRPAPPRGTDWLRQYDCVNAMHGASMLVMAKRSKKSRFKELLRSESRAELEG